MGGTKTIGRYLLLESQEETIIGASWRAAELSGGKVARNLLADIIDPSLAADAGFLENYLSQSVISKKLEHPNIQKKVESINEGGQLASIYEYQEGFSLSGVLERCQTDGFPFSVDHALLVVSKLLSALSYAKGRHITHGFVNPAVVMITHEGEVKLKGFALSSAMRSHAGGFPYMNGAYQDFAPPGADMMGDRDQLDIYACGSILFEMLTGVNFNKASGDPSSKIANAVMEADGEQIPTQIANILISALDPSAPTAYGDIQKMSKDMEELLYSGEYSPTTFNLAFFMHSAFREEMEAFTEKIAAEKERDYSASSQVPATPPVRSAATAPVPVKADPVPAPAPSPTPVSATTLGAPRQQKSKMPMIIGLVTLVAIVILAVVFLGKGDGDQPVDKFEAEKAQLEKEAEVLKENQLSTQQEELRRQNELLREQLFEQEQRERERKKRELEDEMNRMDQEIASLKALKEQERKQKQIEDQLAELQRQKAAVEKQEQLRQEEERNIQAQKDAEAAILAKQKSEEAEAVKSGKEDLEAEASPEPASSTNMPVEAPETKVRIVPPQEGDLVPINDQLLKHPTLLENYEILDAPKKAVRAGLVERDKTVLFLMRALVDENGRVEEVALYKGPMGPGEEDYGMTERAKKHTRKLRFSPPTKLGVKVKVWMIVSIHFRGK